MKFYKALEVNFRLGKGLLVELCGWMILDVLLDTWVCLRWLNACHLVQFVSDKMTVSCGQVRPTSECNVD